jgi:molecular chaperone DnaK (HSP70)
VPTLDPIAAALGFEEGGGDVGDGLVVCDFGGGTLDVAFVARHDDGQLAVPVEAEGNAACGGEDIDALM